MTHFLSPENISLVCLRKPDLDTLAAAFLAGVRPGVCPVLVCKGDAHAHLLCDPTVLCIECGGSGQTHLGNLDHHGGDELLPTAAEQALELFGPRPARLRVLAGYVAYIDTAGRRGTRPPYVSSANLSSLVSGMLLMHNAPLEAFKAGLELITQWADTYAEPWNLAGALDLFPEWRKYLSAHAAMKEALREDAQNVVAFSTAIGKGLALCTDSYGVHGLLREMGARVRLAARPGFPFRYSISVEPEDRLWLMELCKGLNAVDPGWGGPSGGSIIGAPFSGSCLDLAAVITFITEGR